MNIILVTAHELLRNLKLEKLKGDYNPVTISSSITRCLSNQRLLVPTLDHT